MQQMQPSRYPIVSIEDARQTVLDRALALGEEAVGLREALGRFLATDVRAGENLPPFAAASVDGYAIIAQEGIAARRVLTEITAGQGSAMRVEAGTAARIMTGAPVPQGADTVVMVEDTAESEGWVTLRSAIAKGANVLPVGTDVTHGQIVLEQGTSLGSAEVALLATVGHARMKVYRRPLVAVLSTGDELIEPGEALAGAKIRDSNRYGLMAAVAEAGGLPLSMGCVPDDAAEQERRIREAIAQSDVLLTSGGVSVGSRDLIKPILERLGTVHFGRVAIKPGKPLTFATVNGKLVFGLPGFPVSSLVTFELFVRPALLKMQGCRQLMRPAVYAVLEHELKGSPDRVEFQRGIVRQQDGRLIARANGRQASSRVLSLVGANALLRLEPGVFVPAGGMVQALMLGSIVGD